MESKVKDSWNTFVTALPYCIDGMFISLMLIVVWLLNKLFHSNKGIRGDVRYAFSKLNVEKYPSYFVDPNEEYSCTSQQEMLPPKVAN